MPATASPTAALPRPPLRARPALQAAGVIVGVAAAYAVAALIGRLLADYSGGVGVLAPAAGVALAAVVRFGWPAVLGVAIGALVVPPTVPAGCPPEVGAGAAAAAAAAGGWFVRKAGGNRLTFTHLADVLVLTVAAVFGSAVAGVLGPVVFWAGGWLPAERFDWTVREWWLPDAAGVLLVAPILLGLAGRRPVEWARAATALAWTGLVGSAAVVVGSAVTGPGYRLPAFSACLPLLVIAAVRFGPRGAAVANLFTAVVGVAVFGDSAGGRNALVGFLAVAAFTSLCLGAVTAERDAVFARMAADIAAREAAEAARKATEDERGADWVWFVALLEHSHDAIAVVAPDGRTEFVSDAVTRLTGRPPAALVNRSLFDDVHPDDLPRARLALAECVARPGLPTRSEFRVRTADGRWVWLEAISTNHLNNPAVRGVVVNVRDVTERRAADADLREARTLLEATGRLARIGGWEYVIPDDHLTWSEQTFRIHELDPAHYTPTVATAIDFYAPEARPQLRAVVDRAMATGEGWNLTLPLVTATGRRLWVNAVGQVEFLGDRPHRLFGTFQDVTEQKQLEDQLRQSQKLEAVARLAGGVAHDFNNLLTVINGFADLIAAEVPADSPLHPLAVHIADAGRRAAALTRQLLAFSRKQTPVPALVDLAAAVEGLRPLLTPLVGDTVRLVLRPDPVPPVLADRGQLESVVMNLAVNARDAMGSAGTLTIETAAPDAPPADVPPGRWAVLAVTDTGTGIPEDVRPHLFEPFYTTKGVGKGTGLGLSTVYGIVTTAGGHVRFDTAPGRGTTFRVYLPVAGSGQWPAASGQPQTAGTMGAGLPPAGPSADSAHRPPPTAHPRVLLVEDQPAVRELLARMLADAGFVVTEASDGPAALAGLAARPDPPDVLVTDLLMPGMGGRELADRVRAEYPGVRVLFVSGFNPDDADLGTRPGEAFLPKPLGSDDLIRAVRDLLAPDVG